MFEVNMKWILIFVVMMLKLAAPCCAEEMNPDRTEILLRTIEVKCTTK